MTKLLKFNSIPVEHGPPMIGVIYENGVRIGMLYQEIDGFYVFDPADGKGYWAEHVLKELVDKLRELNAPWEEHLARTMDR